MRLALFRLGNADLEYSVLEARLDAPGIDALGQRERAGEAPGRSLDSHISIAAVLLL